MLELPHWTYVYERVGSCILLAACKNWRKILLIYDLLGQFIYAKRDV